LAARIQAAARAGEILVSRQVVDLIAGAGVDLVDRGEHELKGVPGRWQLFAVAT
jgi:class 3 adenylate cyclase